MNHFQNQLHSLSSSFSSNQLWQQETHVCHNCVSSSKLSTQPSTILTELPTYDATANLSTTNLSALSICHLLTAVPTHLSAVVSGNLLTPTNSNTTTELTLKQNSKVKTDTTKLEIEPIEMPLFSGAALESKPITAMYTNAKVNGQHIKLILNSESASSIIT
ncbi:hypothetical protein G9A89_001685 [Geosiphon pyriformis]|nr:hypothetical protein G9A89_001685 [Geosiphon pyriformis]